MLAVLRLALALLVARVALLVARVTLLVALLVTILRLALLVTRVALLITRVALLITLLAILRLTLLITGRALLIARTLALARRTWFALFARRLFGTGRSGGGSALLSTLVVTLVVTTLIFITGDRRLSVRIVRIVRDRIAVGVTATTTTTTTTTTTATAFTWEGRIVGTAFFGSRRTRAILREISDRSSIEHFGLGRCGSRRGGDQFARRDLFRFVGWLNRGNLGSWGNSGSRGFTCRSRSTRRSKVSREHALQRLNEIVFAEPTAILNLVFAGELSEVFDTKSGEIRLIRHGSNSPAQTLRAARLSRRDEWPVAAYVVDPSWAWARR